LKKAMKLPNAVSLATPGVLAAVLLVSTPSSAASTPVASTPVASTPTARPSWNCISKNSVDPQALAAIHATKDPVSVGRVNNHPVALHLSQIQSDAAHGNVITPDGGTWDWVCADGNWRGFGGHGSQD
jgi:hypothetical protein